jgi:large subunit ribosomal protein L3
VRRTTQNLEIIQVREADNVLLIKGAIPGAEGDYVVIRESKKIPKGTVRKIAAPPAKAKGAKAAAPVKTEAKPPVAAVKTEAKPAVAK